MQEVREEEAVSAMRREVALMRVSQIKAELAQRGVSIAGVLEKKELVQLLVNARTARLRRTAGQDGGYSTGKANQYVESEWWEIIDSENQYVESEWGEIIDQ